MPDQRGVVGRVGENGRLDTDPQVQRYLQKPGVITWCENHPREAWALREMQKDQQRCHQRTSLYNQVAAQGELDEQFMQYLWKLAGAYEAGKYGREIS